MMYMPKQIQGLNGTMPESDDENYSFGMLIGFSGDDDLSADPVFRRVETEALYDLNDEFY